MARKFKNYQDYLKSDKWSEVKEDYANINNHKYCALCESDEDLQHHHFNYPKDWNDDSHENIIKICNDCHDLAHESEHRNMTLIDFISEMSPAISERQHENGIVCGQDDVLIRALQVVDVIEERNLTNKNDRPSYRFKTNMSVSQSCNFLPLSLWEKTINGTK
jgi:hypothetical protein